MNDTIQTNTNSRSGAQEHWSLLFVIDCGLIFRSGPHPSENDAMAEAKRLVRAKECDIDDTDLYLMGPDHRMVSLSADDLGVSEDDYLAFLKAWEMDQWCPMPFADLLSERGLPAQAACAQWAFECSGRALGDKDTARAEHLYPQRQLGSVATYASNCWYPAARVPYATVHTKDARTRNLLHHNVPSDVYSYLPWERMVGTPDTQYAFAEVVTLLLDAWAVARPA